MKIFTKMLLILLSLSVIPALTGCSGGSSGGGGSKHKNPLPKWSFPGSVSNSISPDGFDVAGEEPQVATDTKGNTIIVWRQYNGSYNRIFKAEYRNRTWTYPADVTDSISPAGSNAANPQVAMDNNGNAVIVWLQDDQTTDCSGTDCSRIYKSEYRGGHWNNPLITNSISPLGSNCGEPWVDMDNHGNSIITWWQFDQSTDCSGFPCGHILKSEYRGSNWSTALITNDISPAGTNAQTPRVAMNDNDKAVLTWIQYDDSTDCGGNICRQVYMTMYNGTGWSTVTDLADHISPNGDGSSIGVHYSAAWPAMDNSDHAVITWAQRSNVASYSIYRSVYNGTAWTNPGTLANTISPGTRADYSPEVAMSDAGTAMITWYGEDDTLDCGGARCNQIFTSFYNGTAWEDPADQNDNISPDGTDAYSSSVDMDSTGNAIITWSQEDNTTACSGYPCVQIFKADYASGIWNVPADAGDNISPDGTDASYASVSMYGTNRGVISWSQYDGSNYQIYKAEKR